MSECTHAYIGTLSCGCHVAAVVDDVDHKERTSEWVADMIKEGYTVSRHPITELRDGTITLFTCTHGQKELALWPPPSPSPA